VDEPTFQGVERPYEVIFCILSIKKSDLSDMMFFVCKWPRQLIICHQNVLKCDFIDVDDASFRDVERPLERILGIKKSDLDERAEVIFEVGEWLRELIICLLDVLKKTGEVDEATFHRVKSIRTHFLHLEHGKY
jgi:hypothetical protein